MRNRELLITALSLFAMVGGTSGVAAEDAPVSIEVHPPSFTLNGPRDVRQLVVTGRYASDEVRDVTHLVEYASGDPNIATIAEGVVTPIADGTTNVVITLAGRSTMASVTVSKTAEPMPIRFETETLAALTKAGCNMGACHGSPSGKGGFRLSLRGYDSKLDLLTLRKESFGRRTNPMAPDESLLLRKPLMQVAHGGGQRLFLGDPAHRVLRQWIAEGLRIDPPDAPTLERIEVFPATRVLRDAGDRQQLAVTGFFSDGTSRDLTALTVFSSSNDSVASVSETGLVEKHGRGETAVLARYQHAMATANITFLEEVPGFAWNDPPTENFVDEIVFEKLRTLRILPSEVCTDDEYIRRVYLDLTGRLPRPAESLAFLDDADPEKRSKLVDRLLDSHEFASFWSLKWGDVLRSNGKKLTPAGVHKFRRWLLHAVHEDQPLDEFARELLTASGSVRENPAANYWRASRDPEDATETTAQLFLGIRIQCAKCHNHPFERWSQDDYYGIAATFARVDRKKGSFADDEIVFLKSAGEVVQPRTSQTMKVRLLLEGDVDVPADVDRREVFADWLTRTDNPFFAKASVNRIWGHLMGRGIVEPVDDFRDSNPPSNAKLLDELARRFAENGYSRKWAIRTIMSSRVYQLSSRKNEFNADDEVYGSHARTRLLTAEQLLDGICEVTGVPENFGGVPVGTRTVDLAEPPANHDFLKIFGQPQREMACQCERSSESNLSQALQMINGPVVHDKLRNDNGRIANMLKAGKSNEEIIESVYLAALSRRPVQTELDAALGHVKRAVEASETGDAARRLALEDVGWAVLNSKEFLFQH